LIHRKLFAFEDIPVIAPAGSDLRSIDAVAIHS